MAVDGILVVVGAEDDPEEHGDGRGVAHGGAEPACAVFAGSGTPVFGSLVGGSLAQHGAVGVI